MVKAVRLLIWDLDETFWRGTLTEGGIESRPDESISIVKALNRRGIMNSICSKNDHDKVMQILREYGIAEEFIFPSLNWLAKGMRVHQIIESVNLRPESVMFIDDNPGILAEVAVIVPGLQIEDERFVPRILQDWRFTGKLDPTLTRLKQYQVLESKEADLKETGGSHEDFLRQSTVKVQIEYDLDGRLERVIELINRTNQLNYTKRRVSENPEEAAADLRKQLSSFNIQAGLINVADRYGDYGSIGFFMQSSVHEIDPEGTSRGELIHFCFSCRTLGMLIEQWVYQYLGRPKLAVVGEVLTDLSAERTIDWVTLVDNLSTVSQGLEASFPKITLFGGCEANALAVYAQAHAKEVSCFGNYAANGCFVRVASVVHALSICKAQEEVVQDVASALRLPFNRLSKNLFDNAPLGSLFVFNLSSGDAGSGSGTHFREKTHGFTLSIEPSWDPGQSFMTQTLDEIIEKVPPNQNSVIPYLRNAYGYINANFQYVSYLSDETRVILLRELINLVPETCKIILMSDHDQIRTDAETLVDLPWFTEYAQATQSIARDYDFCGFFSYSEVIRGPHEIQLGGNHYSREVFLRAANRIVEVGQELNGRRLFRAPVTLLAGGN